MYNLNDGKLTKFDSPILPTDQLQKNWAPIKIADKIFYLYSYDPLRLMDCTEPDNCTIVNDGSIQPIGPLRTASPFTEVVTEFILVSFFIMQRVSIIAIFECFRG